MSTILQILKFKTASETVGRIIEIEKSADYEDFLERMTSPIEDILRSTDIENQFVRHIPSVSVTLKDLNEAIYEKKNKDLSEIRKEALFHYNLLKQYIKEDIRIRRNIRIKVLALLESLKDFDSIYLDIVMTRQEQLEKALDDIKSKGDIEDLEETIAGTALVFFSILFAKKAMKDDKTLEQLLKIADEYSKGLESWADAIHIKSNPESVEAVRSR